MTRKIGFFVTLAIFSAFFLNSSSYAQLHNTQRNKGSIAINDIVVTDSPAPLMDRNKKLLTIPVNIELKVEKVNGNWVFVTVFENGKKVKGWVDKKHLLRLSEVIAKLDRLFTQCHKEFDEGKYQKSSKTASTLVQMSQGLPVIEAMARAEWGKSDIALGKFDAAETKLKRALQIFEKEPSSPPGSVASTLILLGALYSKQDRYADAEPLLERALKIQEKILGENHSTVTLLRNKLNDLRNMQKGYKTNQSNNQSSKPADNIYPEAFSEPLKFLQKLDATYAKYKMADKNLATKATEFSVHQVRGLDGWIKNKISTEEGTTNLTFNFEEFSDITKARSYKLLTRFIGQCLKQCCDAEVDEQSKWQIVVYGKDGLRVGGVDVARGGMVWQWNGVFFLVNTEHAHLFLVERFSGKGATYDEALRNAAENIVKSLSETIGHQE